MKDRILTLQKVSHFNVLVDVSNTVGWRNVWGLALDFGPACIQSTRNLVRVLTNPDHAPSPCPVRDMTTLNSSLLDHVLGSHSSYEESPETSLTVYHQLTQFFKSIFMPTHSSEWYATFHVTFSSL